MEPSGRIDWCWSGAPAARSPGPWSGRRDCRKRPPRPVVASGSRRDRERRCVECHRRAHGGLRAGARGRQADRRGGGGPRRLAWDGAARRGDGGGGAEGAFRIASVGPRRGCRAMPRSVLRRSWPGGRPGVHRCGPLPRIGRTMVLHRPCGTSVRGSLARECRSARGGGNTRSAHPRRASLHEDARRRAALVSRCRRGVGSDGGHNPTAVQTTRLARLEGHRVPASRSPRHPQCSSARGDPRRRSRTGRASRARWVAKGLGKVTHGGRFTRSGDSVPTQGRLPS